MAYDYHSSVSARILANMKPFTKITNYSDEELKAAIEFQRDVWKERFQLEFYDVIRGVDAYFEQRRRKAQAKEEKELAKAKAEREE